MKKGDKREAGREAGVNNRALEINPTYSEAWYFIKPGKI